MIRATKWQYVDPAERRNASINYGSDGGGERNVSGSRLADAAFTLDDPFGFEGRIEVDVGGE
jgi:hypothetical protein